MKITDSTGITKDYVIVIQLTGLKGDHPVFLSDYKSYNELFRKPLFTEWVSHAKQFKTLKAAQKAAEKIKYEISHKYCGPNKLQFPDQGVTENEYWTTVDGKSYLKKIDICFCNIAMSLD